LNKPALSSAGYAVCQTQTGGDDCNQTRRQTEQQQAAGVPLAAPN
jgi:hypothetical protein